MENKELETWLKETKAKNLSKEDLKEVTSSLDTHFYLEIKRKLGVGGTLYEYLFNQWQKESEFSPKRGDRVLVWDDFSSSAHERIFIAEIKGCVNPILVVHSEYENEFKNNEWFKITEFEHMKPLPTEQPKQDKVQEAAYQDCKKSGFNNTSYSAHCMQSFINGAKWQSEHPTETDFKAKFEATIELIESEMKEKQGSLKFSVNDNNFYLANLAQNQIELFSNLLTKIKQL